MERSIIDDRHCYANEDDCVFEVLSDEIPPLTLPITCVDPPMVDSIEYRHYITLYCNGKIPVMTYPFIETDKVQSI